MSDQKMAAKIAALLAQAEGEAAAGNEGARDAFLERASALQLKYAISDTMARQAGQATAETVEHRDFLVGESNTPLIKAKRDLINTLAGHARGQALLMPELKRDAQGNIIFKNGQAVWDRRAFVRVYAHTSDLDFISALYTSLLLQMQTAMAADERQENFRRPQGPVGKGWRVSYAHGWVRRIAGRLADIRRRQESASLGDTSTALVLRDRTQVVRDHVHQQVGKIGVTRYKKHDTNAAGRAAGYVAGGLADLGHQRVTDATRPQLGA